MSVSTANVGYLIETVVRQPGAARTALVRERSTMLYTDDLPTCSALVPMGCVERNCVTPMLLDCNPT